MTRSRDPKTFGLPPTRAQQLQTRTLLMTPARVACRWLLLQTRTVSTYAPVGSTPSPSMSSNFPRISRALTIVRYHEQSALRCQPYGIQKSENRPTATSSRSYRRRAGIRGTPKRPYPCKICGKVYAQPQGVTRHHREAHQTCKCMYCDDFKWGRRYQFRKHLEEQHPDVDPGSILGKPMVSHLKVAVNPIHSPQRQVSPPTTEHDRRSPGESSVCPLVLPPSAVAEVTTLSPPVMSSLDYDPQLEPAAPMNTTTMHEDTRELASLGATFTYAAASSMEEPTQRANDFEIAPQSGHIWLVHAFSCKILNL